MKIYMSNIKEIKNIADIENALPVSDRIRLSKFSNHTHKLQFLLSRAIVKNVTGESVKVDKNGAPIIKSGFVSIAHKDNFVMVAVSNSNVGIDIENTSIKRDFAGQSELLGLPKTKDKDAFYKNFVKYEAEFKFGNDATKAHKYFYKLGDYLICVCTKELTKDIEFIPSGVPSLNFVCAE